jgi:hypothetical protein
MQRITSRLPGPVVGKSRGAFKSEYDLRAGDAPLAELVFCGTWRTVATARSADGCWEFHTEGFWRRRTLIQRCESDDVVGEYHAGAWKSGGWLELKSGARFRLKSSGMFHSTTEWRTADHAPPLITFTNKGFFRGDTRVEMHASASSQAELPLLVLFGYYLVVCAQREAAIAAAA